jgi:hypothetical protein
MWFSAALLDKLQSFESSDHFQAGGITHTNLPQETFFFSRNLTKVISILCKLEVQELTCPGRESNPGLHSGRRALQKRAIRTAY